MATFEQVGLITQVIGNIYGLVRNMRDNANGYISDLATKQPSVVAANMVGDATEFLRRIQWLTDLASRNQTLLSNALAVYGLTLANANSLKDTLTTVANHTKAATLVTSQDITTESNFILSNVPNFERIF